MSSGKVFIDTSGFFALLSKDDAAHQRCAEWMATARALRTAFVTSDHVLSETATLLAARGRGHLAALLFDLVDAGATQGLCLEHVDEDRFRAARDRFLRHLGAGYSFCDCTSMVVLRELRLTKVLTTDRHFAAAGFEALLA